MTETKQTNDYGMFKKHASNRAIDASSLKRITASIKANNLLEFKPIMVDEQYRVLDGQHRLEAAKSLGIPIFYQIRKDATSEDIVLLCDAQKSWGVDDYCHFYESKGNLAYLTLRELSRNTGYSVGVVLKALMPDGIVRDTYSFRKGLLVALTSEQVDSVLQLCEKIKTVNEAINKFCFARRINFHSSGYMCALKTLFDVQEFDFNTFLRKISAKAEIIRSCSSAYAYLQMFKDVYNFKNQNPIE